MGSYTITTDQREFTIEADSPEHARRIVHGYERPVSVPPAPRPAEERTGPFRTLTPTAVWMAWYREHQPALWDQRLDFGAGERVLSIEPATEQGVLTP